MGDHLVVSFNSNPVRKNTDGLLFELTFCRFWSMDMHEVNVWSELFSLALDIANGSSGTPHDTLNTLLNNLGDVLQ